MKRPSTFGMTIRQIRELFDVGRELRGGPEGCDNEAKRELLESRLAENLPLDRAQIQQLPEILGQLYQATGQLAGDVIGEILKNPSSDLRTIRRVKRHAKRLAAKAASSEEHDAAAAVYYAAIAHALVFQDQRITQFPMPALAQTYSRLSEEIWISKELVALFKQAGAYCLKKAASG